MININNGIKLEKNFVNELNNKTYNQLNYNLKKFVKFLFKKIKNDSIICCTKLSHNEKADIAIKLENMIKYISIKTGSQNSVHVEKITSFIKFLLTLEINQSVINNLLIYHYGDDTFIGNGIKRYSANEAKIRYKNEIEKFNKNINYSICLSKIIDRLVFTGAKNSNKRVDAIYYGDLDISTWCSSEELLNYCMKHKSMYMNTPHFSVFTYQNWCRNINRLKKSESHRQYIQVKWFSILSDINKIRKMN